MPRTPNGHGFGHPLKPLVGQLTVPDRTTFPVSNEQRNWQNYLRGLLATQLQRLC
jgi:hypothetical protein